VNKGQTQKRLPKKRLLESPPAQKLKSWGRIQSKSTINWRKGVEIQIKSIPPDGVTIGATLVERFLLLGVGWRFEK